MLKLYSLSRLLPLALLLSAPSASALTISTTGGSAGFPSQPLYQVAIGSSDVGSSFTIDWLFDRMVLYDLTATATFTIESFTSSTVQLAISVANTTQPWFGNAAIASLGLGTSPNTTASLVTPGAVFDRIGSGSGPQQTYPGGFKGIDVCIFAQNCSGGSMGQLLAAGSSDAFRIALAGDFSSGLVLSSFATKFQTSFGSYELAGRPSSGPSRPIPEPEAALAFAIGAFLVARSVRRRLR
jgi:hypothetical protein